MIIKIERKIYNTETAELIAETAQGSYGDSKGFEEKLYKRGPGDYFIYGHGGENSPYPQPGLFVLSAQDARAWLGRVAGAQAVDKEFNAARKVVTRKTAAKKEAAPEIKSEPEAKKAPAKKAATKKVVATEEAPKAEKAVKAPKAEKAVKAAKAPKAPKAPKA